jgi:two-component system, NtrC family, sensor histidine kinase AtoS
MNDNNPFSIPLIRKHLFPERFDFDKFIDQLPLPALLADALTKKIQYSNQKMGEILNIPREELPNYDLKGLFDLTAILSSQSDNLQPGSYPVQVRIRMHNPVQARLSVIGLAPEKKLYLCLIDGAGIAQKGLLGSDFQVGLVQKLINILINRPGLPIDEILYEAGYFTGVNNIGVYLADVEKPVFLLANFYGDTSVLPPHIPSRDIPMLKKVIYWRPGTRTVPLSNLVIAARKNNLSSLASFPIGSSDAIIGFLVFAEKSAPIPEEELTCGELLASIINLAIANSSLIHELQASLSVTQEKLIPLSISAEHIQEGLIKISPELFIKEMNPAAEAIFGYSLEEALGQPVEHILIGSETLSSFLEAAQKGQSSQYKEHLRLFRRNGDDFLAHLRFLPIFSEDTLLSIVVLVDDLSEKERIRIQTEQLEQRAFLGEVTAIFAHEVRNPINNISTGLQLMSRNLPADDPNQVEITRLEQDCDRLVELMKSVLSLSKPTDYHMTAVDIGQLLQRILDRRVNRLQNTRIFLDLQVDPESALVFGDTRALEQVFNNLINNALQAMGEGGGNLVVKTHPVDQPQEMPDILETQAFVEISVADTGPGIPKEIQDRIFQPFFTTRSAGTGLGLAIAKRIVTFHKGNIRLESFPGGTVFYVTLPAVKKQIIE